MGDFTGVIIKESLEDRSILKRFKILKTQIVPVTERHRTPWVKQWTLHTISIPEIDARSMAEEISRALDSRWYADFKDDKLHYIIFRNKVCCVDRCSKGQYDWVTKYGISIGIPDHQVDFGKYIKKS